MFKTFKSTVIAAALTAAIIPAALQASEKNGRSFGDIYKECGLGGMIGKAVGGQTGDVLAIVTNITWDLGTTAISSDMSSDDLCSNTNVKTAMLIHEGYPQLEKEIAAGEGKYLKALASLAKKENQTEEAFIAELRTKFSAIVAQSDYTKLTQYEKAERLFNAL